MTGSETKFNAFIAAIADPRLRARVEDSAMVNSWGDPALVGADHARLWQAALSTAEECVSCARDYYPELYGAAQ
jgi:hypothetical protein